MAFFNSLQARLKDHFQEVIRLKTTPHEIGLGFAMGTFLSILPTLGFALIIGLFLISIYKRISKISLVISMIVWNPLVLMPMYGISFAIGDILFDRSPVIYFEFEWLNTAAHYTRRFLIGNFILASTFGLLSYFLSKYIYIKFIHKKHGVVKEY